MKTLGTMCVPAFRRCQSADRALLTSLRASRNRQTHGSLAGGLTDSAGSLPVLLSRAQLRLRCGHGLGAGVLRDGRDCEGVMGRGLGQSSVPCEAGFCRSGGVNNRTDNINSINSIKVDFKLSARLPQSVYARINKNNFLYLEKATCACPQVVVIERFRSSKYVSVCRENIKYITERNIIARLKKFHSLSIVIVFIYNSAFLQVIFCYVKK